MLRLSPVCSALAALMIASVLSGCGGGSAEPIGGPTSSDAQTSADPVAEAAAATAAAEATRAADEAAAAQAIKHAEEAAAAVAAALVVRVESIECGGETFDGLAAAWATPQDYCPSALMTGENLTAVQTKAAKTSLGFPPGYSDFDNLGALYAICAECGPDASDYGDVGPEMASQVAAAMTLCPTHPNRAVILKSLAKNLANAKLNEGRVFGPGTYRVGKEIKPGTYFVTDVDGCYWERTNSNGVIIDNYVTLGAKRVQVTIRSSDYSFNSERCGEWHPVS